MKLSRKLIPAFAMLLVSAIMLTTASYAWFSLNTEVKVNGMTVKTSASDSVLIVGSELTAEDKALDSTFTTDLSQTVSGLLNPVSTVNGTAFFYNNGKNVEGDGDAKAEDYEPYDADAFNTAYGTTGAVAYVDYVFQIKVTNADTANTKDLNITALDLKYGAATDNGQKAFRVAVFAEKLANTESATFAAGVGTLKTILAPTGALYHTTKSAVSAEDAVTEIGTALSAPATLGTVAANSTEYYKVVVRLWLEGEDTTCINDTFANLAGNPGWALNLSVSLGGTAVTTLGTSVTP